MSPQDPPILEIGRIGKPHGLRGEVVVSLITDRVETRTAAGATWLVGPERRPLTVAAARPHQDRWLVRFDGAGRREDVEALRGHTCYAEALDEPDTLFAHEIVGKRLVDQHGVDRGEIVALVDNPAADLLELADGALVPLTFVGNHDGETVTVDVPEGLFED